MPGSPIECPIGMQCWTLAAFGSALCWPSCCRETPEDCAYPYDCAGECDSDDTCIYTESMSCDPSCGALCDS